MQLPLIYVDCSIVREGKLAELKTAIRELAEFVAANEPRIIGYDAYFNADETEMTVIHLHPDSDSLAHHMKVAGPLLPPFAELLEQQSIDVFGEPSAPFLSSSAGRRPCWAAARCASTRRSAQRPARRSAPRVDQQHTSSQTHATTPVAPAKMKDTDPYQGHLARLPSEIA